MQKRCILNPQVVVSYFISTSWGLYTIISEGKFTQPVDSSSLNRLSNSVNIASDMRIAVNDGYILKVKQQGVEVSGGNDPYDTEAYMKAQKMAGSLSTLLRNACGNMHTVAYSQEEYARWTEGVSDVMGYLGIDYSFYR